MKKSISIICALTGIAMLAVYCFIYTNGLYNPDVYHEAGVPAMNLLTVVLMAASFIAATVLTSFRSRPAKIMTAAGFAMLALIMLTLIITYLDVLNIANWLEIVICRYWLEIVIYMLEITAALFIAAIIMTPFRYMVLKISLIVVICVPAYILIMGGMRMVYDFMDRTVGYILLTAAAIFLFVPGTVMKIVETAKIKRKNAA